MVAKIELRCIAMFILLTIAYDTFIRAQDSSKHQQEEANLPLLTSKHIPIYVGSPSNVTGCNGETVTTSCPFEYYDVNGTYRGVPHWMVFDGSGESLIFTLTDNESKNGFYYPSPGINDSEAKLIVQVNPKIDGYHVACRLALIEPGPIDSPNTGTINVIDHPSCPKNISIQNAGLNFIFRTSAVILTWHQSNAQPVTFTTVTYCPKSSPNCGNSINCTSPCAISGLNPGTEYQFTIIPSNKCGTPLMCRENTANLTTKIISIPPQVAGIPVEWLVAGSVLVLVALILFICFVSMIICRRYCYKSLQGCLEIFRNRATKNKVNDTKRKEDKIVNGVVDLSEHTGNTAGSTTQPI